MKNKAVMKGVVVCIDGCEYWNHCFEKEHPTEYLTVKGKDYQFCPVCNIKWCVGSSIHDDLEHNIALSEECKEKILKDYEDFTDKWIYWHTLSKEQQENFGFKPEYGSKHIEHIAKDLKIGSREIYRCIQFAREFPELPESVTRDRISWRWIRDNLLPEHKEDKIETPPLPEGKYGIIYADPPWSYNGQLPQLEDLEQFLTGEKKITWKWIVNELLPEHKDKKTETPELPEGKYQIIYADPAWKYCKFCKEWKEKI